MGHRVRTIVGSSSAVSEFDHTELCTGEAERAWRAAAGAA